MLRVVTEFVAAPSFLLLCDNHACGCYHAAPVPQEVAIEHAMDGFLKAVTGAGWLIGIGRQLCASHAKQAVQQSQLVQVANGALAKSFKH